MAVVMAVVLFFLRRHYPPHIHGLGHWAAVPVIWLVSSVLYSGRGNLPVFLSVIVANTLLMFGAVTYYLGCRLFFGFQARWRYWTMATLLLALVFAWLVYGTPSYAMRLVWLTAAMIGFYATTLVFLLRHGGKRLPVRMVELVLGLQIGALSIRLVTTLLGDRAADLLEPSLTQTLYVAAYVFTVLMLSLGAVLMASDRLATELQHLATHDPLTHTLNRRAVLQHCAQELARSQRSGRGPALLMLDLDHFKQVNDTHGHQHGDAVLKHFARTTQELLRRQDRLGRYGGEEFTLLLPETSVADAQTVARRIHTALASGRPLDCQLSIGLTAWLGPHDTLEAMLARADGALYQAKEQGRNQTCTA